MTRCPALRVDRRRGEEIRQRLVESGRLRTDLTISREDEHLLFPLIDSDPLDPSWGERVDGEFEPLEKSPNMSYRDLLHWPEAEEALLPRSFDVIGDIVLVRIPLALRGCASEIGEALRQFVPGTRLVGADFGVHGEARQRRLVVIDRGRRVENAPPRKRDRNGGGPEGGVLLSPTRPRTCASRLRSEPATGCSISVVASDPSR